jgi:hypothetical protein
MSKHERTNEAEEAGFDESDQSDRKAPGPTLLLFGKDQTPADIAAAINAEGARQERERGQRSITNRKPDHG